MNPNFPKRPEKSHIVIGIILFISLGLLIGAWSLLKKNTKLAHELLGGATFTLVVVFLLELKWPSRSIQKTVAAVSALIAVSSIVIGSIETERPRSDLKEASIRRLPINCTIYALTILAVTVFRLLSSGGRADSLEYATIQTRLKTSAIALTGLIVILGVLIAIGIRYKQHAPLLEVYWKDSLAVALALIFVLAYNWVGERFRTYFETDPAGSEAIRSFIHDIIFPIKIACAVILVVMTIVNNAGRFRNNRTSWILGSIGFFFALFGFGYRYWDEIRTQFLYIVLASIVIGALVASIPTTPFIRDNKGVFGGMIALVAVTSVLFMLVLIAAARGDDNSWADVIRVNRINIATVAAVSVILYILLQTSGFLEASLDLVTDEHVRQSKTAADTETPIEETTLSPEIEKQYVYESDVWSQVFLAAGILGAIVLTLLLLYVMSASIGLATAKSENFEQVLPIPSDRLWWLAIVFSILMNGAYLYLYFFTKRWAHRINKTETTEDENQVFGIEFLFVLVKFILFFYVLVAIGLIYVNAPQKTGSQIMGSGEFHLRTDLLRV